MDALTYLESQCRLRRNVLTGETLYAPTDMAEYKPLSVEAQNTLLLMANSQGVDLSEEQLQQYIHSTIIEQWNPAKSWMESLEPWDGNDYVEELAQRIITSNPDWPHRFHKWMLQMVARWMGLTVAQNDVIVPVIVGQFGYGKTTFCNLILPPSLRRYYTDQVRVRQMADVHELVTTHLLVALDEFYQENTDQLPAVRYLFSRSTPVQRWPYGTTREPRKNYAAFIATTGNLHPMTDAAGAAHLFCVEITHAIDTKTPIDYDQLYAQVMHELQEDEAPYWFHNDEVARIQQLNQEYMEVKDMAELVEICFRKPNEGEHAKTMSSTEMLKVIKDKYPSLEINHSAKVHLGNAMKDLGFEVKICHNVAHYFAVPLKAA